MAPELEKVEQQLAILKMAGKGPGLQDAVARALAEPGLFVYGELVQLPSIQQVRPNAYGALAVHVPAWHGAHVCASAASA